MSDPFIPTVDPDGKVFSLTIGPRGYSLFLMAYEKNKTEGESEDEFFLRIFFVACVNDRKVAIGTLNGEAHNAAVDVLVADAEGETEQLGIDAATELAGAIGGA